MTPPNPKSRRNPRMIRVKRTQIANKVQEFSVGAYAHRRLLHLPSACETKIIPVHGQDRKMMAATLRRVAFFRRVRGFAQPCPGLPKKAVFFTVFKSDLLIFSKHHFNDP